MTIKLNENVAKELTGAMTTEGDIKLPFPAPVLWVLNGNPQLKDKGGARYFGGWATTAEDFEAIAESLDLKSPPTLTKCEFVSREGEAIEIYSGRHVSIAPIGKRLSSTTKDGQRFPGYHKGASPHLQVLAYLAYKDNSDKDHPRVMPWSPVVLSAKGYQVGNILDALQKWESITLKARKQFAPGVPAWTFYCTLGTFGDKVNSKSVGQGNNKSPITPIELCPYPEFNETLLSQIFVGESIASEMVQLRSESQDWLNAWKTVKTESEAEENNNEDEYVPAEPSDDIPF